MQVRRLIHIFNGTDEIVSVNGWEIKCHPQSKIENYLSILGRACPQGAEEVLGAGLLALVAPGADEGPSEQDE